MPPEEKVPNIGFGSNENFAEARCPYCGFGNCWKHGCYARKGSAFHTKQGEVEPAWQRVQRWLCRHPPCGRTFSQLPQGVLPYCRFFWSGLLEIGGSLASGLSAYRIFEQWWPVSYRAILGAAHLIGKVSRWLDGLCRELGAGLANGLAAMTEKVFERHSWFSFTCMWYRRLYPKRFG